jgi:hypothetical protein
MLKKVYNKIVLFCKQIIDKIKDFFKKITSDDDISGAI